LGIFLQQAIDYSLGLLALALTKIDPPSAHKVDPPTVGAHSN